MAKKKPRSEATVQRRSARVLHLGDNGEKASVELSMPIHSCFIGYAPSRFELRLSLRSAAALKVLASSYSVDVTRLRTSRSGNLTGNPEGPVVDTVQEALQKLLEDLADEIEQRHGIVLTSDLEQVFQKA